MKPQAGMAADEVVELETYATPPFAGGAVRRHGLETRIFIPGLYWMVGRMVRAAIAAEPERREPSARLLTALPAPRLGA